MASSRQQPTRIIVAVAVLVSAFLALFRLPSPQAAGVAQGVRTLTLSPNQETTGGPRIDSATPTIASICIPIVQQGPTPVSSGAAEALAPTPDGVLRTVRVPILMYHHISEPSTPADPLSADLSVSPQAFEEQLVYLKAAGYESVTLDDLALALQAGHALPPKPVILTFDDGYRDHYTTAFPLLCKYGYKGTFFVVTGRVDQGDPGYLTWEQISEMHAAGMHIEPHSYNHPDLRNQPIEYVIWQVLGSKEAIEQRTGEQARFFSYPAGQYDDQVVEVLRSLDFWGAVVVEQGAEHRSDAMFALKRIRVRGGYTADDLAQVIDYFMIPPAAEG